MTSRNQARYYTKQMICSASKFLIKKSEDVVKDDVLCIFYCIYKHMFIKQLVFENALTDRLLSNQGSQKC